MFKLAHTSDWHATSLAGAPSRMLATKRFFGWLSWHHRRRATHRPEMLTALLDDVEAQAPDSVVVTGDLTNVALEQEFIEAASQLARLGRPDRVFLIPGNHDAYAPIAGHRSWDHWAPYLRSGPVTEAIDGISSRSDGAAAPTFDDFPTLRMHGDVALIGLCSALPTPLFRASGRLGATQLGRLEACLGALGRRDCVRIVLLHHPVCDAAVSARRRLTDAAELRGVLERAGAELVLHGHRHRAWFGKTRGPSGPIPVVGVASASDRTDRPGRRAQYHLIRVEKGPAGARPRFGLEVRGVGAEGRVERVGEREL